MFSPPFMCYLQSTSTLMKIIIITNSNKKLKKYIQMKFKEYLFTLLFIQIEIAIVMVFAIFGK